jgi:hydroxypyruvate reductase
MHIPDPKAFLRSLFEVAVAAAHPARLIEAHLPERPKGRTVVIGAGKAGGAMAAFEKEWLARGNGPLSGLVVTSAGNAVHTSFIEVAESRHPVPDDRSVAAAGRMLKIVSGLTNDDLVVALISGGASSLLCLPHPSLTLEDKQAVNRALLAGGVPIEEMNCIRKHLSAIKGGRLAAAAAPAKVLSLVISDIPGDNPALVGSGPTIPDGTTPEDARRIVSRYRLELPERALALLNSDACAAPSPDNSVFDNNEIRLIGAAQLSLDAAAAEARKSGLAVHILSDAFEGEARDLGQVHAALARQILTRSQPFSAPALLLSGGEATVTLRHKGRGGRNSEFLLSFARHISGLPGLFSLAADTDGIDGSENNAGASADGSSFDRMRAAGIDPALCLEQNDAYSAFAAVGDLLVTGPTGTNVNDFRAILIGA